MSYFNKYYLEFSDGNLANPIDYRIDILDSQGATPTNPFKLTHGTPALTSKRVNDDEDKKVGVFGKEITITYVYTGNANEPTPDDFFDADERRFRIEVRVNGTLNGVYYAKGDLSSAPYDAPPYNVQVKAVDGLNYAKSVKFNLLQDGLLLYDYIDLYQAIMTRGMLQIVDPDVKLSVLNSLYPTNIVAGLKLFFNCYVHTDNFFDFTSGPKTVYDALNYIATSFRLRIYLEDNILWAVRIQDLTYSVFNIDQYSGPSTAETIVVDMVASAGPSVAYDSLPLATGNRNSRAAYKRVQYKAEYRAINRLINFDWRAFSTGFDDWSSDVVDLSRRGSGTIIDPYKAFLPYDAGNPGTTHIQQEVPFTQTIPPTLIGPAFVGDRLELTVPWKVFNVDSFKIRIRIQSNNPGSVHYLSSGGSWTPGVSTFIEIKRSKKKQQGSYSIITDPIPKNDFDTVNYAVWLEIYSPTGLVDFDGLETPGVEIFPIKLGINNSSSKSFITVAENAGNYSLIKDEEPFQLFDNGDIYSANVLVVNTGEFVPIDNWDSDKANVAPNDLEYHMTRSYIDQYSKSVRVWEGTLFSNVLKYFQLIEFAHIPGKRYMQINDSVDHQNCTHNVMLLEVFDEGNAEINYTEYDIEDEKD